MQVYLFQPVYSAIYTDIFHLYIFCHELMHVQWLAGNINTTSRRANI